MDRPLDEGRLQAGIGRKLRSLGIQPTAQRLTIASIVLARPQHLTADQVLAMTNSNGRLASKATIYNTLGLFARTGLLRELVVGSGRTFYDSNTQPHGHFYDPESRQISDLPEEELQFQLPHNLPAGRDVDRVEVVIHLRASVGEE